MSRIKIRYYLKITDGSEICYIELAARTLPKAQIEAEQTEANLGEIGIKNGKGIKVISRKNVDGIWELVFN